MRGDPERCSPPSGKIVAVVDNTEALGYALAADSAFCQVVFGKGGFVEQLPLGYAVRLGARLLTQGPESLSVEAEEISTGAE